MTEPSPTSRTLRKRYYDEAASWSADVHGALRASRRIAWIIAMTAVLIAGLEALALAALAPLKTVVPVAITVDRQTGYVQAETTLKPGALSDNLAVTQSNLVRYVTARESFDATDLRENYRQIMLWSGGEARAQYADLMRKSAPDSPLNLYPTTSQVSVNIESVSLLTPTTALVRFSTTRQDAGGGPEAPRYWAAAIAFHYVDGPMTMSDRFINPLGFQVTRYRRDSESPTLSEPQAASAPRSPMTPPSP